MRKTLKNNSGGISRTSRGDKRSKAQYYEHELTRLARFILSQKQQIKNMNRDVGMMGTERGTNTGTDLWDARKKIEKKKADYQADQRVLSIIYHLSMLENTTLVST